MQVWWSRPADERVGRPLVVALHGRGADESSLALLADEVAGEATYASVRAPIPEGDGFCWFAMHSIGRPVAGSLLRSRELLARWLERQAAGADGVALLGFSDGAMLAADVLVAEPSLCSAAVLLGGALPWETDLAVTDGRLTGLPVLYSYGADDDVIPRELLTRTEEWLTRRSGAALDLFVQRGLGHAVSTEQVERARAFLDRHLARGGASRADPLVG